MIKIIVTVFLVKGVMENFLFTKYNLNVFAEKTTIKVANAKPYIILSNYYFY